MRAAVMALIVWPWAGPVFAEVQPRPDPTEVSPLTVMPSTQPPKVVATFPAAGQAVASGVLVISITFDQPMTRTGFDIAPAAGGEAPACLKTPRLLADGKTFVLLCSTGAGKTYGLAFNGKPTGGFANLAEKRAQPATLAFTTTDADPVRDLDAALKAAKLQGVDVPVQEDPGLRAAGP